MLFTQWHCFWLTCFDLSSSSSSFSSLFLPNDIILCYSDITFPKWPVEISLSLSMSLCLFSLSVSVSVCLSVSLSLSVVSAFPLSIMFHSWLSLQKKKKKKPHDYFSTYHFLANLCMLTCFTHRFSFKKCDSMHISDSGSDISIFSPMLDLID